MKKRIFIPCSFPFIILILFLFLFSIFSLFAFIWGGLLNKWNFEFVHTLGALISTIFLSYSTIRIFLSPLTILKSNHIYKCSDLLPQNERIQYKCIINYSEINNIEIIASNKNSKNKTIKLKFISSSMPKKYLEFALISGKKERICIHYFTKSQIIKLLNYINCNMHKSNNINNLQIDEIMKNWYTYGGYNKVLKK